MEHTEVAWHALGLLLTVPFIMSACTAGATGVK